MLPKEESRHFYEIALSFVPDVGPKTARALLAKFSTPEDIFKAPLRELKALGGLSETKAKMFRSREVLQQAERELEFVLKNDIEVLFLGAENYPRRFLDCEDPPVVLYYKGNANLNAHKMIAVIGTRKNTDYGLRATEELIEGLGGVEDVVIVSGLALGIDTIAHKASLKNGMPTVGVMGNGLDKVYPGSNKALAQEMTQQGGLLTEFPSGTVVLRQNFPVRNRVVAGMSDVTVVVESDVKGGAMITAYLAHGYNREVAAIPGRVFDSKSEGPNHLIRKNLAAMITRSADLLDLMNWRGATRRTKQPELFLALSPDEERVFTLLKGKDSLHADELLYETGMSSSALASLLLQMEMRGLIKALPGKHFRLD